MVAANLYWFLGGLLTSAVSALFLINDLKQHRTYLVLGDQDSIAEKMEIRRDASPWLFFAIVGGISLCTAYVLVTCSAWLTAALISNDLTGEKNLSRVVFIPGVLVILYLLQAISARVFARWWDN